MGDLRSHADLWLSHQGYLPDWAASLLVLIVAAVIALVVHRIGVFAVERALPARATTARAVVKRVKRPAAWALVIVALTIGAAIAPLTVKEATFLRHALLVVFILVLGGIAKAALDIFASLYTREYDLTADDNLLARKHVTQVKILRQAANILIVIVTIGLALMTINGVKQWGVSLLAAGGAASVIVGLALQPLLTNLIAGVQIAMTQPIRLDDAVIVENEWGRIEEITSTYVVVRIWDLRRMVLPLSYFIQKPFQNWTRESASLIGTSMFYVDYAAPVDAMRAKLEEIAKVSPLWDGEVVNLAVTDLREQVMEVRCLVSARNAGKTFDLRCEVREKMVAWLQAEYPQALPRRRIETASEPMRP